LNEHTYKGSAQFQKNLENRLKLKCLFVGLDV
jgi:hypothetical protein